MSMIIQISEEISAFCLECKLKRQVQQLVDARNLSPHSNTKLTSRIK